MTTAATTSRQSVGWLVCMVCPFRLVGAEAPGYLQSEVGMRVQTEFNRQCHHCRAVGYRADVRADHCRQLARGAGHVADGGVFADQIKLALLLLSHIVTL